jgi:hypothetical protein
LVEKLAYAVAASESNGEIIVQPLTQKQQAIIKDPSTTGHAVSISNGKDQVHAVVQTPQGNFIVVPAADRSVGLNPDGSLNGASIGLIVGCILGAALIAVVIIAFSVVRKRRTAVLDQNTPLLQDKGWQVE